MALKLKIERSQNSWRAEFPNGYFRIFEVNVNKNDSNVRIGVFSYPDELARRFSVENNQQDPANPVPVGSSSSVSPVSHESYSVSLEKFDSYEGDAFAKAYEALKDNIEKFFDAEDC